MAWLYIHSRHWADQTSASELAAMGICFCDDASWNNTVHCQPYRAQLSAAALRIRRVGTLVLPRVQAERCCRQLRAV
jgi:hypothetical protein